MTRGRTIAPRRPKKDKDGNVCCDINEEQALMEANPIDIDGYFYLVNSKTKPQKIFWVGTTTIFVIIGLLWNTFTIERYINSPTSQSVEIVHKSDLEIPDVIICSHNIFNISKMIRANMSIKLIRTLNFYFTAYAIQQYIITGEVSANGSIVSRESLLTDEDSNNELMARLNANNQTFEDFLFEFGIDCERFLLECSVGWRRFNCCKHAVPFGNHRYGKCFALADLDEIGVQIIPSESSGLAVLLDPSTESRELRMKHRIPRHFELDASIEIYKVVGHSGLRYKISSGKTNYFLLKAFDFDREPDGGTCVVPSDDSITTSSGCMLSAWETAFTTVCKCRSFGYRTNTSDSQTLAPVCTPKQAGQCRRPEIQKLHRQLINENCPKPVCQERTYEVDEIRGNLDVEYIKRVKQDGAQDYAQAYVFHGQMSLTAVSETYQITFNGVISDIGGNTTLFIGGSIITLVQLLHFAWQWIWRMLKNRRNRLHFQEHRQKSVESLITITTTIPQINYVNGKTYDSL